MKRISLILGISLLGLYIVGFLVLPPGHARIALYYFGQDRTEAFARYAAYDLIGDECEGLKLDSEYKACWSKSFDKAHSKILDGPNATQRGSL